MTMTEAPVLARNFYNSLLKWKDNKNKKAMLVTGARQIGKTSLIRRFGKEQYECFVELNFITLPRGDFGLQAEEETQPPCFFLN
jgi:predicted AAA+ superfamily ATPase